MLTCMFVHLISQTHTHTHTSFLFKKNTHTQDIYPLFTYSSMQNQSVNNFKFPPGVRFHPSDEELIIYYLLNKVNSKPQPAAVIGDIELYNYNPWDLPKKALFGENEWYFYSPRDRKYPNGARPNRSAASGYWKATGTDKPITSSSGARIGVKKALVFYIGKPPQGVKTHWIMIEYRIPDTLIRPQRSKSSMRLDNWVLCRIRQKGNMSKNTWDTPKSPVKPISPPVNTDTPSNTCASYFMSKDCQLLAKLLTVGGDYQQSVTVSSTTSQNSNTNDKIEPSLSFQRSLSDQHEKTNGYGNLPTMLCPNETYFYNHSESQGQMLKLNLSNSIFTDKLMHSTSYTHLI